MPQHDTGGRVEWGARAASGIVMIVAAIAAVAGGGLIFISIVAACAIACLREWHRLVNGGRFAREALPGFLAMIFAPVLIWIGANPILPIGVVLISAGASAWLAASRHTYVFWHGAGVLYIGLPVLGLMALREWPLDGAVVVGGLFAAIWASDTGALLMGRVVGGPKLAPGLSPNKTWSGFVGGILAAGIVTGLYAWLVGGALFGGVLLGISLGFAGHCGDLFESWVKRQFRAKNMGTLIPGHGGMLDRVDSLLFAAPTAALLLFVCGFDPLLGYAP